MFIKNRAELVYNLEALRKRLCCYSPGISFCDCKYGATGQGEKTGCPELRSVIVLLKNMTGTEFQKIIKREKGHEII